MGNFTGSAGPHYTLRANVYEINVNAGANQSTVRTDLWIDFDGAGGWGTYSLDGTSNYSASTNGNGVGGNFNYDFRGGGGSILLRSWDTTVNHDGAGNATIGWSAHADMTNGGLLGTADISGSFACTHINRTANIDGGPNFNVVTDEWIEFAWHADSSCDYISWWSSAYDGGAHHDIYVGGGQGWWTIDLHNLQSEKQYDLTVAVRRADSGLWTNSGTVFATTHKQTNFMRRGTFR